MPDRDRDPEDPLKNIIYISIPDNIDRTIGTFTIDPSILLPVELPPGSDDYEIQNLSWEMIVSAMLKVLAYRPDHEHADYYRNFVLTVDPTIIEELTNIAILKAKNQDYDIAEEIFKALSELIPYDANNMINLALVYEQHAAAYKRIGNNDLKETYITQAFDCYKEALRRDPDSSDVHFNAGHFFSRNRNVEKAKEHFRKYTTLGTDKKRLQEVKNILKEIDSQDQLDTLFKEAYDFIRMGQEHEGIKKINKFLEERADVSNAWFLLGWAYRRTEQYQQGKDAFLKALELGCEEPDTLNELAICLMELGELKESRKRLAQALQREPENVKIISNLGILSLKEHKEKEAIGFFKTVLEIEPEDPIAQQYISFLTGE